MTLSVSEGNSFIADLELVHKFCYLGDMLSVGGDADAAVETRIWIGWNKFRQLLTNKDISLIVRGRVYNSCVQSSMLHGWKWDLARKKGKWGGTLSGRDENGEMDVWR